VADFPDSAPDWIKQLQTAPGPTADTLQVQSPANGLWYTLPRIPDDFKAPPMPPPPPPPGPGLFERAWDTAKAIPGEAMAQISPSEAYHENVAADAARWTQAHPDSLLTEVARHSLGLIPGAAPLVSSMVNRDSAIWPESPEQQADIAARAAAPAPGFLEGLKNAATLFQEHPGALVGQLIQQTAENPQYLIGGDLGLTAAAARIAKSAGAADAAAKTAGALGRVAGQSGSFAALTAGTEAVHEAGAGALDPEKIKEAGEQGAVIGPAVDSILRLASGRPVMRVTLDELKKGLDRGPQPAAGEPLLEGPPGSTGGGGGAAGAPAAPSAPTGTLSQLATRAREAGVAPEDIHPIMADRLRRNISDDEARTQVQHLIDAATVAPARTAAKAPERKKEETPKEEVTEPATASKVAESPTQPSSEAKAEEQTARAEGPAAGEQAGAPAPAAAAGGAEQSPKPNEAQTPQTGDVWRVGFAGDEGRKEPYELTVGGGRMLARQEGAGDDVPFVDVTPRAGESLQDALVRKLAPPHGAEQQIEAVQRPAAPTPDEHGIVKTKVAGQPVEIAHAPTPLQEQAGNFKQGHITIPLDGGIPVTVQKAAGMQRSGVDQDGKTWTSTLKHDYGYAKRTIGADKEPIDVFVGPNPESKRAYVVDQNSVKTGDFDEHKLMLGFNSREAASDAYLSNYPKGWTGRGHVTPMSIEQAKDWLDNGDTKAPAHGQQLLPAAPAAIVAPSQPEKPAIGPPETAPAAGAVTETPPQQTAEAAGAIPEEPSTLRGQLAAKPAEAPAPEAVAHPPAQLPHVEGGLSEPERKVVADLGAKLSVGALTAKDARGVYEQHVGEKAIGAHAKRAEELTELAVVHSARDVVTSAPVPHEAFDKLVDLYGRQPTFGTRTSTSVEQQAYSTPAPLAYVASHLAGITPSTTVLEPTAGNGMLLMAASPKNATVNELNPSRAAALREQGFNVTTKDAVRADFGPPVQAVIANPPFGVVRDESGASRNFSVEMPAGKAFETHEIDHAIALHALDSMMDDGRAVLIIGGINKLARTEEARSDAYNGAAKRKFFYALHQNYNVADHFTVAGELYAKQGAAWPVDVVVIAGRGKSAKVLPAVEVPRVYNSWADLKPLLDQTYEQPHRMEPSVGEQRPSDIQRAAPPAAEAGHTAVPGPVIRPSAGDAGPEPGPERGVEPVAGHPGVGRGVARPDETAGGLGGERPGGVEPEPAAPPAPVGPAAEPAGLEPGGTALGKAADIGGQGGAAQPPGELGERRVPNALIEGPQQPYEPASREGAIGTLVPTNMRTAIGTALDKLQDKVGPVDRYVAQELGYSPEEIGRYFSAEQLDALGLALSQMKSGKGFIIGDQTGIGKGRVVAGVIRWALKNGQTPIFVTEKPNLYADMYRDLTDIGVQDIRPVMTNGAEKVPLDDAGNVTLRTPSSERHNALMSEMAAKADLGEHNMIFTTYSQMQTLKGAMTPRMQFLAAFAPNGVTIFDESHNAGGTDVGGRAKKADQEQGKTGRAGFARHLAKLAKAVFYSSATYAKRPSVMDLYFKTDMAMAVDNDVKKLPAAITAGGVPLQQVVASMLSDAGQYIRRERSFAGVEYNTPVVPVDRKAAEAISAVMLAVKQFDDIKQIALKGIKKELKREAGALAADQALSPSSTNFTSVMHNLIDQMLLALKADAAADLAIEAIKRGEHPVVTVANTMGSFLESYAEEAGLKNGDAMALSFGNLMARYLERSRDVTTKANDGTVTRRQILDEELGREGVAKYEAVKELIKRTPGLKGVPVSPIDWLHYRLNKAGYKTSEITGRTHTLRYSDTDKHPTYQLRGSKETSIAGRRRAIMGFNSGALDALIINQAGATGLSLHASEKFKDKRRRRMVIAQAERNIDTHMQMLGRVHRTGQVVAPAYDQLVADIPAEKRPAAVLAKKMASLNANTTGARSSQFSAKDTLDFDNQYGDEAAASMMEDMPEIHEMLGEPLKDTDTGLERDGAARKVSGRLPMLEVTQQEAFYELFAQNFQELLDRANALGENALEAKTLALDAKPVSKTELFPAKVATDSPFGAGAYANTMDVKRLGKPYTSEQVRERLAENAGFGKEEATRHDIHAALREQWRERVEKNMDDFQTYLTAERAKMADSDMKEEAQEGRVAMLTQQASQWHEMAKELVPGKMYSLRTPEGTTYYAVLQKIERKKGVRMPTARGSWLAHFDVADGMREITFPFSKLSTDLDTVGGLGKVQVERASHHDITRTDIMQLFDEGQTVSREKRVLVTGNLLAGFSKVGRGQIANFTDHEGNIQQGVLMPRSFDLAKFAESQPVQLTSEQAGRFLEDVGQGIVRSSDNVVTIRNYGPNLLLQVPRSKAEGGKYFLDQGLRDIVGDFTSGSSSMRVTFDRDQLPAVLSELSSRFDQKFYTDTFKEEAQKAGGSVLGQAKKQATSYARPAPTLRRAIEARRATKLAPNVADYLKRVETALRGHAQVQVHANPKEFGEAIDQDVPPDVAGAYTSDDGTLHFVASNLPDVAAAQAIFRHEGFGHLAMEKSPDFEKALAMVGQLRKMGGAKIKRLYDDVERRYPGADNTTLSKEVIATMAERGVKNAIVDRAITGALSLLRKMGIETPPAEAELRQMIVQAARGLPVEARALSGLDRVEAYAAEAHVQAGREGAAMDALGRVLPESDAIDALSAAKRAGNTRAIEILKDLQDDASVGDNDNPPLIEDAYHPVEASIPREVLFARHAPMDAETKAARDKVMDPDGRDDMTLRDRQRLGLAALRKVDGTAIKQYWIDDLASIAKWEREINGGKLKAGEESPLKAARSVRNLASQMAAVLEVGIPEHKDGVFQVVPGRLGLKKVFEPLSTNPDGSLIRHFELYAAARRALRLINERNRDGTLREKNFTQTEIDAGLALAKKYPELERVFHDLQEVWTQLLDLGESAGTIDPEARRIYERFDYVPFYRAEEELAGERPSGGRSRGGLANQREMSGRLTGKAAPLRNILENVMMNIANQMDAAQKNIATLKAVDQFQNTFAFKVPKEVEAVHVSNDQIERAMKNMGLNLDPNMTESQRESWTRFFRRVAPTDRNVIRVMRDGKPEYHRILDPLVLDALTSIQGSPKWLRDLDKRLFGMLSGPKRFYTAMSTATPMYTARRFLRVMFDTAIQQGGMVGLLTNAHRDFYDSITGHKDLYDMMMAGAGGAQGYDQDPERVRRMLIDSYKGGNKTDYLTRAANPKNWWKVWRAIQNASKNEHMLRVYRAARKQGASVAEAAFRARDIEDLSMHGGGAIMQFINRTVPFLNPRIQGTYRMARGFKDNWRGYAIRGAMVTAATLGLQAYNWDNPRYQELPEWEKDMSWHVFIGDHHFMLPKPFELGLIFATLPERLVSAGMHAMGKPGGDTAGESIDAAKRAVLDTFALNPVPLVLRPLLAQAVNVNAFGNKILTDKEAALAPQEQYNDYTSPMIRAIAGNLPGKYSYTLNSPARLQALVQGYTSSLGITLLDGADRLTRRGLGYPDAPSSSVMESAFKSFYQSGEPTTTKYTPELYDFREQADKAYNTLMALSADHRMKEARAYLQDNKKLLQLRPMLNALGKDMKELNKQQAMVMESTNLTADQKKARIDKITAQKNAIARHVAPFEDYF